MKKIILVICILTIFFNIQIVNATSDFDLGKVLNGGKGFLQGGQAI